MGLDMYLDEFKLSTNDNDINAIDLNDIETKTVIEWRKANAIHNWFVENIQNGNDDVKPYLVTYDELKSLRDVIQQVVINNDLAKELLPTTDGFFFGSTSYDEDYFLTLNETLSQLNDLLKVHTPDKYYVYQASW